MLHRIMDMQILLYAMAGMGVLGIMGMTAVCLAYKRRIRKSSRLPDLKEKWINLCEERNVLMHKLNRWVWVPSLISTLLLCLAAAFSKNTLKAGMVSSVYLQMGAAVPLVLLVMRQALDFTGKEDKMLSSMMDYLEEQSHKLAEVQAAAAVSREREDAMVDYVAGGIKESDGGKGRFGELLSPEEEEIMREVIREFMA